MCFGGSDNTVRLHGCLCPQAAGETGSEAHPELLVEQEADDGVRSSLSEAHPHRCGQVELRDRSTPHKYSQVAGAYIRSPEDKEGQCDHVVHLPDPFLHLKLVQHQQPPVAEV